MQVVSRGPRAALQPRSRLRAGTALVQYVVGQIGWSPSSNALMGRGQDDFPWPEAVITTGRIWSREEVEKWAKATGREIVTEG
jgi:hypothetical protein